MNRRVSRFVAGWRTGLPRSVLILQAGNALNYLGYGLVLPFEIIYLHHLRGFSTTMAGLVLAAIMGTAALVTPPTGALVDRYSAKSIVVAGNVASAVGYAGFAFVERPWQAFACAIAAGAGFGAAGTANRTLMVRLISAEQRASAFALNRVAGNFGIGLGATVGGFIVAAAPQLSSFQILYLFDAVTSAVLALIVLAAVPNPRAEIVTTADAGGTGFRAVARDRLFVAVIALNIVLVVVGHTFFSNILSPFAQAHTPVGPGAIGIIFLVNTSFIVIAQIPAVRFMARIRRGPAFAAASALFAVALLAVLPATLIHSELAAATLLAGVAIVFALGEVVHILVLGPLVADMAPAHLLGRYLSLYSLAFTLSLALGPAIGGLLLQTSPDAIWWGGALAVALAGAFLLRLGARIPEPLHEAPSSRLANSEKEDAVGSYQMVDVSQVEAPNGIVRALTDRLGVAGFRINQLELAPGAEGVEHDHIGNDQEEVYAVVAGGGVLRAGGEEIPLRAGHFVHLPPDVRRQMVAGDQGLTWIGIGSATE
jgi:MFS family permease